MDHLFSKLLVALPIGGCFFWAFNHMLTAFKFPHEYALLPSVIAFLAIAFLTAIYGFSILSITKKKKSR
ncbi:hypothetical protein [Persicobacter diffluens]|uniref:Uncharacterized protein n=1 Tax=Persicobacter diffluens TaxID=981 RepID=A0AAN4W0U1_9BACT|nr:hypothetical protein PEDI_33760 [Persicobacter diffluens]